MFEKEAEEYYYKTYPVTLNIGEEERKKEVTDIFIKGAKFGYNKANEWHYVKDGDLPDVKFGNINVTVAYLNAYDNPCKMDCCFNGTDFIFWDSKEPVGWKRVDIFGKIYAWRYLEKLPELPKEDK